MNTTPEECGFQFLFYMLSHPETSLSVLRSRQLLATIQRRVFQLTGPEKFFSYEIVYFNRSVITTLCELLNVLNKIIEILKSGFHNLSTLKIVC